MTETTEDATEGQAPTVEPAENAADVSTADTGGEGVPQSQTPDVGTADTGDTEEPETFSRDYVEKLRQENGKYRQRAGEADSLATRLHTELVRATGRLADPTDLPFDADHLADADKMAADIEDLLTRKPHLATRRPVGEIGQGATPPGGTVDLAAILRGKA
ncbi:MAG: hypothetical protein WA988_13235 [Candidatus Nanopelagicales bacterium]